MENISGAQVRCVKTLMGKVLVPDPVAMVRGFTSLRTEKVSDMTMAEASALIKHLKGMDPAEVIADRMRKKIMAIAYNRAGLSRDASVEAKKEVIAGLKGWLFKYGYLHKGLDAYKPHELPKLVTQYEAVLVSDLKSL